MTDGSVRDTEPSTPGLDLPARRAPVRRRVSDHDDETAVAYVRRVCEAKGTNGGPTLNESEYVRYLTVGRHKPPSPVRRSEDSGDRLDEVF